MYVPKTNESLAEASEGMQRNVGALAVNALDNKITILRHGRVDTTNDMFLHVWVVEDR